MLKFFRKLLTYLGLKQPIISNAILYVSSSSQLTSIEFRACTFYVFPSNDREQPILNTRGLTARDCVFSTSDRIHTPFSESDFTTFRSNLILKGLKQKKQPKNKRISKLKFISKGSKIADKV